MKILTFLLKRIGFSNTVDRAYSLLLFVWQHHRRPGQYLFNDRMFWMRWNGDLLDPLRQLVTDKCLAKDFVRCRVGAQYTVPMYAVLRSAEEIDAYQFPTECVVKPSHGCGDLMLVSDGRVDRAVLKRWLKQDYYRVSREQNYAFLKPGVLVEEYALGIPVAVDDYKMHCVDGVPKAIQVDHDRFGDHRRVLYDAKWQLLPYGLHYPIGTPSGAPPNLEEMLRVASALAQGFPVVRIDFYTDGHTLKVGEITNCHGGGSEPFLPRNAEEDFSKLLFG